MMMMIVKLDDFRNNSKKKNLRWYFWELLDELLNRIGSVYKYRLNSVSFRAEILFSVFQKLMGQDSKRERYRRTHNEQININNKIEGSFFLFSFKLIGEWNIFCSHQIIMQFLARFISKELNF